MVLEMSSCLVSRVFHVHVVEAEVLEQQFVALVEGQSKGILHVVLVV